MIAEAAKAAAVLFVAALAQASLLAGISIGGGSPDLLLVAVVAVAFLRGSAMGAAGGFFAGLVLDTARLETLGLTSLLLTILGYWVGRYGETTGRDRAHAPFLSIVVATFVYAFGNLILHFVLGQTAPAHRVLEGLLPALILNVLLAAPVYTIVRRLLRPIWLADRATEVRLLG